MKIAHENNPEASCEDLGGIEGQAVLNYLNSRPDDYVTYTTCEGEYEQAAYPPPSGPSFPYTDNYLVFCGSQYSYFGCYSTETLDEIWQEVYDFGMLSINSNLCNYESPLLITPKLYIEFVWYTDNTSNSLCSTEYSLKANIYWFCCEDPGVSLPPDDM